MANGVSNATGPQHIHIVHSMFVAFSLSSTSALVFAPPLLHNGEEENLH